MLRGVVAALGAEHEVVVAARPALLHECSALDAEVLVLPEDAAGSAAADLRAFDAATAIAKPDHRLHLYAVRPVLARWAVRRRHPVPTSALVISPSALHYPRAYGTPLSAGEWANALVKEALARRFLARRDTHAVLTMDPAAARRWTGPRAHVSALPEPPVPPMPATSGARDGVILYGALSARKGVGHLARALEEGAAGLRVVIAGRPEPGYAAQLDRELERLRRGGVRLEAHLGWIEDQDALGLRAGVACVVIPYVGHKGTSRVLVEAATAGTPVVAHASGLVGAQVRDRGLGTCVDVRDPAALRAAILELTDDATAVAGHAPALRALAAASTPQAFGAAVREPFARGGIREAAPVLSGARRGVPRTTA